MIKIGDKKKCCGCGACANACLHKSIVMKADNEGFLYPFTDETTCVDCHLCENICPILNVQQENVCKKTVALSAKAVDENIRMNSSSGGVFSILAEFILKQNGVVFGAAFDDSFHVFHKCISNTSELYQLRGSKYVQSETKQTFTEVKEYLKCGKKVMYAGTPCQIEGLYSFLHNKNTDNLITIDFICHGVPSPKVWSKYVDLLQSKYNSIIENVFFRNKRFGWKTFSLTVKLKSTKIHSEILVYDKYMQTFLRNISLRPSCYACAFKKVNRISDITLADFWGISKVRRSFDDNKGVSLVLLQTDKGKKLFESVKEQINSNIESLDFVKKINQNMIYSALEPKSRTKYFANIDNYPFERLYEKYVKKGIIYELKNKCKGVVKIALYIFSTKK